MTIAQTALDAELAYYETELGCQLVVETSGSAYGARRATDGVKILTAQSLVQTGTRHQKVNPRIRDKTG